MLKLKPVEVRIREIMLKEQVDAAKAEKIITKLRKTLPASISGDYIYLKLFKFIPRADLEMLFPNTRVKMRQIDKLKLGVTAGGGGAAGIATTIAKLSTVAALTNPLTVGMAMIGLGGIVFRQVSSVFATRTTYMAQLSKNLYFNNLANNHSVMAVLSERGEEEDIKEEVLLYTLLARSTMNRSGLADAKLAIEHYLQSEFQVKVSFDIARRPGEADRDGRGVRASRRHARRLAAGGWRPPYRRRCGTNISTRSPRAMICRCIPSAGVRVPLQPELSHSRHPSLPPTQLSRSD